MSGVQENSDVKQPSNIREREGGWEAEKNNSKIYREEFLYLLVTDSWISAVEKWS